MYVVPANSAFASLVKLSLTEKFLGLVSNDDILKPHLKKYKIYEIKKGIIKPLFLLICFKRYMLDFLYFKSSVI